MNSNIVRCVVVVLGVLVIGALYFYSRGLYGTSSPPIIETFLGGQCANENHLFIVIMATYPRSNGGTKKIIKRTLKSLLGQTYKNWKLFVTGDFYEPDSEFHAFFDEIPKERVFTFNLPTPGERLNLTGMQLWESGGVTAMNDAMERAERQHEYCKPNCKIYLTNLDDDDIWSPDHLRELLSVFIRFPEVVFVWTRGYYCGADGAPFPGGEAPQHIVNNWYDQFGGRILHSSWGWKMDTFRGLRYRRQWDFPAGFTLPKVSDYDLFERVHMQIKDRNLSFFHSTRATIEHLTELGKTCNKQGPLWYPE